MRHPLILHRRRTVDDRELSLHLYCPDLESLFLVGHIHPWCVRLGHSYLLNLRIQGFHEVASGLTISAAFLCMYGPAPRGYEDDEQKVKDGDIGGGAGY